MKVVPPKNYIREGTPLQLQCVTNADGYYEPIIKWTFVGNPFHKRSQTTLPPNVIVNTSYTVFIQSAESFHSGKYTCSVKTKFGEAQDTAILVVARENNVFMSCVNVHYSPYNFKTAVVFEFNLGDIIEILMNQWKRMIVHDCE